MERMNESSENYLESILILEQRNPSVRMSDIAAMLHVSKPSVNKAMGVLKDAGYIQKKHVTFYTLGGAIQVTCPESLQPARLV